MVCHISLRFMRYKVTLCAAVHRLLHAGSRSWPAKYLGRVSGTLQPSQIEGDTERGEKKAKAINTHGECSWTGTAGCCKCLSGRSQFCSALVKDDPRLPT